MIRKWAISILIPLCMFAPTIAMAAGLVAIVPSNCQQGAATQCSVCDLVQLAQNVLNDGILIAVILSAIVFAWSGFKMVVASSTGDVHGVQDAKRIFWYVFIGLILMLAAWLIIGIIIQVLTGTDFWGKLCTTS